MVAVLLQTGSRPHYQAQAAKQDFIVLPFLNKEQTQSIYRTDLREYCRIKTSQRIVEQDPLKLYLQWIFNIKIVLYSF